MIIPAVASAASGLNPCAPRKIVPTSSFWARSKLPIQELTTYRVLIISINEVLCSTGQVRNAPLGGKSPVSTLILCDILQSRTLTLTLTLTRVLRTRSSCSLWYQSGYRLTSIPTIYPPPISLLRNIRSLSTNHTIVACTTNCGSPRVPEVFCCNSPSVNPLIHPSLCPLFSTITSAQPAAG